MNEIILFESLRSLFNLEVENSFNVSVEYNFIFTLNNKKAKFTIKKVV